MSGNSNQMTKDAASRIQSSSDKPSNQTGDKGDGFSSRAQSAADKNANAAAAASGGGNHGKVWKK
ncbi:hypothetical protein MCOR27_000667 [Pyricularia oryzae]|uniref:SMP domain-containing protein n=3 Tax=Pyricularia oryzae TaxID=318829 RepID=G4NHB2_PYRO7|nr:uncharacterized protein MGG_17731 [Pyricularia oryzae 70-15]ELQ39711.1 hypothetical protein OOU_Y34scaffold00487g56 [Pyricularia oryzae Y34]KAH8846118.1 hypothetical protein MCOR01_003327 [Pyricularia oryzae]EHA47622.1 hypothetical protein MGG_17731 [Pyricularia oryzae 70-15]KAI6260139.1 hypothetical protein MCOR19_003555 [Pyricularia oryzae]KAI6271623.1 hypothetical protein MCOR26_007750 [Pyricularia oryzae]